MCCPSDELGPHSVIHKMEPQLFPSLRPQTPLPVFSLVPKSLNHTTLQALTILCTFPFVLTDTLSYTSTCSNPLHLFSTFSIALLNEICLLSCNGKKAACYYIDPKYLISFTLGDIVGLKKRINSQPAPYFANILNLLPEVH